VRRDAHAAAAGGDVSRWGELVGAEHVSRGGPRDAVDGVVPAWIVRPGGVAEVQACVREAAAEGAALVASGLGAHLDLGVPPSRLGVVLKLDRLARVVDHQAGDMTVTVEAGCPLGVLAGALSASGQWLPLDPPRPGSTTAGGLVAANLSGPLRASQGRVRDLLIGIRTVGADGALVSGGGRVVKNVAGYDLPKLHVGALGTAGVIVEATFKVRPRPGREEAVVIACRSVEAAGEAALAVMAADAPPFWLELAGPGGLPEGPGDGAAVVVGLAGIPEEVEQGRARVMELARARGLGALVVPDGAGLRTRLADFSVEPATAVLRAGVLATEVGRTIASATARGRTSGVALRCLADVASGVVRIVVPRADAVAPLVAAFRAELEARGGSLVVERAGPALKADLDVWGDVGPGLGLMRRVKAAFDPAGILAPGRFVGGL
jgi:glycolate oxidase FAD binding subunit